MPYRTEPIEKRLERLEERLEKLETKLQNLDKTSGGHVAYLLRQHNNLLRNGFSVEANDLMEQLIRLAK